MVNNPPRLKRDPLANEKANVVVVSAHEDWANKIESHLRNTRHKMRALWTRDIVALEHSLQKNEADLLIVVECEDGIKLTEVIACCRRFAPNVPVLAMANALDPKKTIAAVKAGARDLVSDADDDCLAHLVMVYERELCSHRNARDLAQSDTLIAAYESRYSNLIDETGDAVAHISEGIFSHVNPAFIKLLGYKEAGEIQDQTLMDFVAPESLAVVRQEVKQLLLGRQDSARLQCELLMASGQHLSVEAGVTRCESEGESYLEMLIQRGKTKKSGKHKNGGDTSRGSRVDFYHATHLPAPSNQPRAVMMIEIDKFQDLEERIGFLDAELIVRQAEKLMAAMIPDGARLYRISTFEFGSIFSMSDALKFEPFAKALTEKVGSKLFSTDDHDAQISVTAGIYPLAGNENMSEVIHAVVTETRNLALRGGGLSKVFGPTAKEKAEEQEDRQLATSIRRAIEDNRLRLAYQSIASLNDENLQHFDVLCRMIDEDGSEIQASDFIRAAEKGGLMKMMDRWVVLRALKTIATRAARDESSMLFVKLSEDTLKDIEKFISWVRDVMKPYALGPDSLTFKLREPVIQNHIRKAKLLANACQQMNVGFAVNYFGSGPNSEQMLEHLPLKFVKFHHDYTAKLSEPEHSARLGELIKLAKKNNVGTIVCHVEGAEVMAKMWQLGVDFIQGYHIHQPEIDHAT